MKLNYLLSSAAAMSAVAFAACDGGPEGTSPAKSLAASARTTSDLQIESWEVRPENGGARIIGVDQKGRPVAEAVAWSEPSGGAERVRIEVLKPQHVELDLLKDGAIDGTLSPEVQRLVAALYEDLGHTSKPYAAQKSEDDGLEGIDVATSALTSMGQGSFHLNWSFFGYAGTARVGSACIPGFIRTSADAHSTNGASCWVTGWFDPQLATDCQINVHYGIDGFLEDDCNWFVYGDPPPQFSFPYQAAFTNYATQGTTNITIAVNAGQTLSVGTCGLYGASFNGDTYIRLNDPNGSEIGVNDDNCSGLGSLITRTAAISGVYTLRAGCYSNNSCSGVVAWEIH